MGLLDIFFKKWTYEEKLAYLKAQMSLLSVDGHSDDNEYKTIFKNMKIIKWKPDNETEVEKYMSDAKNMTIIDGVRIIKNMKNDKKKIVSLGLKTMALADNKLVESEVKFLKDFEVKTGIPNVTFSKKELAKFKYTKKGKTENTEKVSQIKKEQASKFHENFQNIDSLITSLEEGGISNDYKFVKLVFEKLKIGYIRNEEQLNNFILSFLRKQSKDGLISKTVNFQAIENILGSSLVEFEENNETSFKGYIELEQYHSVATRGYQLCQQVMFEFMLSAAK